MRHLSWRCLFAPLAALGACEAGTVDLDTPFGVGDGGSLDSSAPTCGVEVDDRSLIVRREVRYVGLESLETGPGEAIRAYTFGNDGCWRELNVSHGRTSEYIVQAPTAGPPVYLLLQARPDRYAVVFGDEVDISETLTRRQVSLNADPGDSLSLSLSGLRPVQLLDDFSVVSYSGGLSVIEPLVVMRGQARTTAEVSSRELDYSVLFFGRTRSRPNPHLDQDRLYVTQAMRILKENRTVRYGSVVASTRPGVSRIALETTAVSAYSELQTAVDVTAFHRATAPLSGVDDPIRATSLEAWVEVVGYPNEALAKAMVAPSIVGGGVPLGGMFGLSSRDQAVSLRVAEFEPRLPVRVVGVTDYYSQTLLDGRGQTGRVANWVAEFAVAARGLRLTPSVRAPWGARFGELDARVVQMQVGETPRLSWQAQSGGGQMRHRALLWSAARFNRVGDGVPVAEFVSERPEFRFPPGLLSQGSSYFATLVTETTGVGLLENSLPFGVATAGTAVFSP
jgi:hypothetical protein